MFLFVKRVLVYLLCYVIGMFYGTMVLCRLLWNVFREGTEILKWKPNTQGKINKYKTETKPNNELNTV